MDTKNVRDIIIECLEKLTLEYESVIITDDEVHPVFSIKTVDSQKLIGNRGENLRAFNYIVKRIVERRLGLDHPSFMIDVNNYQQERNEEIRKNARILIERVRTFKSSHEMEPLNAYERMLIHTIVADDPEIESESIGQGSMKKLVLRYKDPEQDRI